MDMSGMSMSTATSSGAMATASAMAGMDMDSDMMAMSDMAMVFFTSTSTPLYSSAWTPKTTGQYVGTCIFLILLSFILRILIAGRINLPELLVWFAQRNDTILLRSDSFEKCDQRLLPAPGRPWNINEALIRAVLDTILAGVSYLLMLAVMTMNVGYFASVLAGAFLGSFILGGWIPAATH